MLSILKVRNQQDELFGFRESASKLRKGRRLGSKNQQMDRWIRINADGALDSRTGDGGIGLAVRGHLGMIQRTL
jgi:hypothetical protein